MVPRSRSATAELAAFLAERLAAYKQPADLWVIDELPRTPTGKLLRAALRERVTALSA